MPFSFFETIPTIELIQAQVTHLKNVWRLTHNKWGVYDTFYNRTFPLWDRKLNRPTVHPAKPKSIVDTAVDQMMGHEPTYERFPRDVDDKDEADSGEKALKSIHSQAGLLETELPLETVKKNLILYGYAVLEDSLDSVDLAFHGETMDEQGENEGDEPFARRQAVFDHKKKTLMPFRTRAPHPSDILMDPSHKNPRIAIKVGKWFAADLAEITENRLDEEGNAKRGNVTKFEPGDNPFQLIDCVEYWTENWHALMITGSSTNIIQRFFQGSNGARLLFVETNTWGFVPFSHAFAGFGHQPTNPTMRGTQFLAVGMLDSIMDDLVMDAQKTAGKHNAQMEAMFAKRGTTEDAANIEEQEAESDTINLESKSSLWYLEQPTLQRWLNDFGIENDRDIEGATFPRTLAGIRDTGVNTVGQQAILSTAGQRRFIAPTQQVNHMFTKSAEHILQWIDVLDLDLVIEGNEINKVIVDSDYAVKVEFKVVNPVLQLQERSQALTEYKAGVMDLETFWSISGQSDATGARERLWDDEVYRDPVILKMFKEQRAKKLGLDKLMAEEPDVLTEPTNQTAPTTELVGVDGRPISSTLGTGTPGADALREPLDARTFKPARTGANLA